MRRRTLLSDSSGLGWLAWIRSLSATPSRSQAASDKPAWSGPSQSDETWCKLAITSRPLGGEENARVWRQPFRTADVAVCAHVDHRLLMRVDPKPPRLQQRRARFSLRNYAERRRRAHAS